MNSTFFVLAGILGLGAVGFSMHGQGGGVLYTPLQVLFGVEFHEAVVRSQWFTIVTSLSAVLVFRKARKVDWRLALVLESAGFAGAFVGGYFSRLFPAFALTVLLAALVVGAGFVMLGEFRPPVDLVKKKPWHWMRRFRRGRVPRESRLGPAARVPHRRYRRTDRGGRRFPENSDDGSPVRHAYRHSVRHLGVHGQLDRGRRADRARRRLVDRLAANVRPERIRGDRSPNRHRT